MSVTLGHNQYGKAETRVVRVYRDADPHEIVDYNVSVALSGDFEDMHLTGDNANCLTTDATKNTVNAFAKEHGEAARQPESFGIALARHFVDDIAPVSRVRVKIEMYPWKRLQHNGSDHPHAFVRDGGYIRTASVTYDGDTIWAVSGVNDYVVLKTTDSEFFGYMQEKYTTLKPTHDRVMATAVTSQWWHTDIDVDWSSSYETALATMSDVFAGHHSLALQQTMYAMGEAMIDGQPEIGEVRFSLPNKHHFVVDLSHYGLENANEVFHADDRPYGFIEGTIHNTASTTPGLAFDPGQGW
ncbi:MAG: factor-independent urate hydroxylase [Nakamurella sp.]